jgi:hypothetical protein
MLMPPDEIAFDGWRVSVSATEPPLPAGTFFASYTGAAFEHPERGMICVLALAHPDGKEGAAHAAASAQLVVHSVADGYFGARRTFGPRRAAAVALGAINSWLFGQIQHGSTRHFSPVSLTALVLCGDAAGIAHIGAGRLYRRRRGAVMRLTRDHVRLAHDGWHEPTRAIGLDLESAVDYNEEPAEPGDEYLLTTLVTDAPEAFQAAFALEAGGNAGAHAGILLKILETPARDMARAQGDLATLPLRAPPREGDVWDGFRIGKTIYRGRYTMLKAARDEIENRDVALKIPLPSMLQDEIFAAGFMREAWIGTTIRGANIARYIDLPEDRRSSLYLVMPLYKGETLEARLNRAPPVSLPDGVGIAIKLCEAVQDLAAIQVIHRDIKPENIMLLDNNSVKLIDLGLAYLPGIDQQDAVRPGGTMRYMAPELFKGVQANDRSEVFALAVTIYRMFSAGPFPFGQHESVPLKRLRPDLPQWLGTILGRALREDPAARFADAGALAAALQAGLVSGKADAPPGEFSLLGFSALACWRAAAVGFGLGFLGLLLKTFLK